MPKKQEGTVSAGESNEILVALSLLAVQPAGELFLFEIPPYSAQNDTSNKENDSLKLKKELEYKLVVDLSLISQEQSELHLGMQYLTGKRKN